MTQGICLRTPFVTNYKLQTELSRTNVKQALFLLNIGNFSAALLFNIFAGAKSSLYKMVILQSVASLLIMTMPDTSRKIATFYWFKASAIANKNAIRDGS